MSAAELTEAFLFSNGGALHRMLSLGGRATCGVSRWNNVAAFPERKVDPDSIVGTLCATCFPISVSTSKEETE